MSGVRFEAVTKRYAGLTVVDAVDIDIAEQELAVFVGPSGCGKSTLLRMLAGLEEISSGTIHIGGEVVTNRPPRERDIAMVFQSYALYPHMTVEQNIAFPLRMMRLPRREQQEKVLRAASMLGLEAYLERYPRQLSGGQRQRVAMGRAVVRDPAVFLFDEPLSNLDAALRMQMRQEIARLHREIAATMIYVTHDQVEAMTLADRIVVLREGRIEQIGTPHQVYSAPQSRFVAEFIGAPPMNFLPGTLVSTGGEGVCAELAPNLKFPVGLAGMAGEVPGPVTIGIRPEALHLGNSGQMVMNARILRSEYLGATQYLHAEVIFDPQTPARSLIISAPPEQAPMPGDTVPVSFAASDCHLFSSTGRRIGDQQNRLL